MVNRPGMKRKQLARASFRALQFHRGLTMVKKNVAKGVKSRCLLNNNHSKLRVWLCRTLRVFPKYWKVFISHNMLVIIIGFIFCFIYLVLLLNCIKNQLFGNVHHYQVLLNNWVTRNFRKVYLEVYVSNSLSSTWSFSKIIFTILAAFTLLKDIKLYTHNNYIKDMKSFKFFDNQTSLIIKKIMTNGWQMSSHPTLFFYYFHTSLGRRQDDQNSIWCTIWK